MAYQKENGRSIIEVLGVLAVIGVLSVMALLGYRNSIIKRKADMILRDSQMALLESKTRTNLTNNTWHEVSYPLDSGYTFQILRDKKRNDYVKVMAIEKALCDKILTMFVAGKISFLNEDGVKKNNVF